MSDESAAPAAHTSPRWRPLEAIERRVLGVLVEKAKTTPENYPLSLNAIRTACNQKNNRAPLMQLEEPQVDDALEKLRGAGAVSEVQGTGRVSRFRHLAYDWLGVEKVELAVMAELLLRGSQTVGELRGRAARMEPIKDLHELQPTLDSLKAKRLIQYLTPPGRGCIVTHTLYLDREMDKVRREADAIQSSVGEPEFSDEDSDETPAPVTKPPAPTSAKPVERSNVDAQLTALRNELTALKQEFAAARAEFETTAEQLRNDLTELNRQLGN